MGPLAGDLANLIWHSALVFNVEPESVPELEPVAVGTYLAGLHGAGWKGNAELVQVGYVTWIALWIGAAAPAQTALCTSVMTEETMMCQFSRGREAAAASWAILCELALNRADEARQLMDQR